MKKIKWHGTFNLLSDIFWYGILIYLLLLGEWSKLIVLSLVVIVTTLLSIASNLRKMQSSSTIAENIAQAKDIQDQYVKNMAKQILIELADLEKRGNEHAKSRN
ncbi:hypothetical protein MPH47_21370 [Psychrobacillus psychrodurans]|uniref:hypothetical protein n=1 Tax=Psychrobacillus psychrodurans TaxID=126157 RepID=UPI001F4D92A2|nr:hypothetical protein [Psychrobacillus psychrodurans]MCK1999738.1 hypothetical protein [Psychrobacillus psychrodurans]